MTKPGPEDLAEQIAQLGADLAKIAETLAALGKERGEDLRAGLAEGAGERLASAEEKLAEVTEFARRNPGQALALAGGAGLLLGLIFGRR